MNVYSFVLVFVDGIVTVSSWFWVGQDVWHSTAAHDSQSGHVMVSGIFIIILLWSLSLKNDVFLPI